jgi:hypothetical protein
MPMLILWVVTPCGLVGKYQRFGETYFFHLQRSSGVVRKWVVYIGSEEGRD